MANPFALFKALIAEPPLQIGTVLSSADGTVRLELPDGGVTSARGDATVGSRVFFRDGVVEATAPSLPIELIEI